ncbi:MAG: YdeI/OmpD-associated family protein [Bacteroidota bacterium]
MPKPKKKAPASNGKKVDSFCPEDVQAWREWLKKNHASVQSIWLILYKKNSGRPVISWSDAVDQALCFGWVDSIRRPINSHKFMQLFSQRKPAGTWSKINKEKVDRLIANGLMMPAGLHVIERAKQNGSWNILDTVESLSIPADLTKAFRKKPGSKKYFSSLSKSVKKMMLSWLALAKRPETRSKRVNEIAEQASIGKKPTPFQ